MSSARSYPSLLARLLTASALTATGCQGGGDTQPVDQTSDQHSDGQGGSSGGSGQGGSSGESGQGGSAVGGAGQGAGGSGGAVSVAGAAGSAPLANCWPDVSGCGQKRCYDQTSDGAACLPPEIGAALDAALGCDIGMDLLVNASAPEPGVCCYFTICPGGRPLQVEGSHTYAAVATRADWG